MQQHSLATRQSGPGVIGAVWGHRWIFLATVALVLALGAGVAIAQAGVYEAVADVHMSDPRTQGVFGTDGVGDDARRQQNRVERFLSPQVLTRAAELVGTSMQLSELDDAVDAAPAVTADQITVTATTSDPVLARDLANAVVDAYREQFRDDAAAAAERTVAVLDAEMENLTQQLATVEAELEDLGVDVVVGEQVDADEVEDAEAGQVAVLAARKRAHASMVEAVVREREETLVDARLAEDVLWVEAATIPPSPSPDPTTILSVAVVAAVVAGVLMAVWRSEHTQVWPAGHAAPGPSGGWNGPVPDTELRRPRVGTGPFNSPPDPPRPR